MSNGNILTPPPSGERAIPFDELVERVRLGLPASLPREASRLLVALDIDGTLLLPTGLSERVLRTFRELTGAGAEVVIASGRGINAVRPVLEMLGARRCWAVCSNGAVLVRWDVAAERVARVVTKETFSPAWAIDTLVENMPGVLLGVEVEEGYLINEPFPPGEFIEPIMPRGLDVLRATPTAKLVARAPWMPRDEFDAAITAMGLPERTECAVGWTSWVDIGPLGVTKASGLAALADRLGIGPEGTVAVGDGMNDIAMLRWAAHGVAMGGASDEVRAAADAVTGAVENDGAAALMGALLRHCEG